MKHSKAGFSVVEALLIVGVLAVIGLVGYKVFLGGTKNQKTQPSGASSQAANAQASGDVKWAFNSQTNEWFVQSGKAPECKDPFVFDRSPINMALVTNIGMPGSYRGYSYKPHGALRLDASGDGHADIRLPMDAKLVGLTRYYEGDPATLQYLLTFESECGIAFRFDHLYTLAPAFQQIAETTPEPKKDDTRVDPNKQPPPTPFKSGELVATAVGFPATHNFGFDFGVYDYRQPNDISKNAKWAAVHAMYPSQEWYGVCWFGMLPDGDAARAKALSLVVVNPAKPNIASDYCTNAPHTTLDFNDGKPTDG
jgi:hypothetical protein